MTIRIHGQERDGVDEGWIAQTLTAFRREGQPVCARVSVDTADAKVDLTMGACPGTGGGREPNPAEARLIDAWRDCVGSDSEPVEPGQAIRCIKRIERLAA